MLSKLHFFFYTVGILTVLHVSPLRAIDASEVKKLSQDPYWKTLLHFSGNRSEIDDGDFFLSPQGQRSAYAELNATIEAFQSGRMVQDVRAACYFPGRYEWIREKTGLFPPIEKQPCEDLKTRILPLQVTNISIMFPSEIVTSPISMFGHTFIRLDATRDGVDYSYAINFAADIRGDDGVRRAMKGLFGFYKGHYSLMPYSNKRYEYLELESRDIWEFKLNFTDEETRRMLLHAYELRHVTTDYLFVSKNCSYNLLWLFESAREGTKLRTAHYREYLPYDVVKMLNRARMIQSVRMEKSRMRRFYDTFQSFNSYERRQFDDLIDYRLEPETLLEDGNLSAYGKLSVLSAAIDYTSMDGTKKGKNPASYVPRLLRMIKARKSLGIEQDNIVEIEGMGVCKFFHKLGVFVQNHKGQQDPGLTFRYLYHDHHDVFDGFPEGANLNVFELSLIHRDDQVELDYLTLVDIMSLPPDYGMTHPLSWRVKTGVNRFFDEQEQHAYVKGGVGQRYLAGGYYHFWMLQPSILYKKNTTGAMGLMLGNHLRLNKQMKWTNELETNYYHDRERDIDFNSRFSIRVGQKNTLMLHYQYYEQEQTQHFARINFNRYF